TACAPLPDESGAVSTVLLIISDITARVKAEQALREREQRYRSLFDSSVAFICLHKLDGTLITVNPAAAQNLGFPVEKAAGLKIRDYMPASSAENFDAYLERVRSNGRDAGEMLLMASDGSTRVWSYSNVLVRPPEGEPYVIGHAVDITGMDAATRELAASEDRYRTLFESGLAYVCTHKMDGTILSVNPAAAKALGYPAEAAAGRKLRDFQTPEAQANFDAYLEALRTQGHHTDESHFFTREGEERIWEYSNVVVRPAGRDPYVIAHAIDITEFKKAERALRDREQYIRLLLENSSDVICILEADGRFRYISPAAERLFGYKPEERVGASAFENMHPEDVPRVKHAMEQLARSPGTMDPLQYRIRHASGRWIDVEATANNMLHEPVIHGLVGSVRDISERKRAEEKFRKLLEAAPDAMVIVDQQGAIALVNLQAEKLFGYSREELVGQPVELLIPKPHREQHVEHRAGFLRNPRVREMGAGLELHALRKDGTEVPVEISLSPLQTPAGPLVFTNVRDVSDRKAAEADRERLIAELQEAIGKVKTLTGLLPICASCKKIRDDRGTWNHIESYIRARSEAEFSHGICPECARRLYPEDYKE
ncbi:MAG TPA: PAS domain S-box protein, partial [Terriglobales bacterium]|nr:PAS domain S-box protein [Terriglobales bacterium]